MRISYISYVCFLLCYGTHHQKVVSAKRQQTHCQPYEFCGQASQVVLGTEFPESPLFGRKGHIRIEPNLNILAACCCQHHGHHHLGPLFLQNRPHGSDAATLLWVHRRLALAFATWRLPPLKDIGKSNLWLSTLHILHDHLNLCIQKVSTRQTIYSLHLNLHLWFCAS